MTSEDIVTVSYTVDDEQYMRACYALWAHRGLGRIGNYISAITIAGLGALLIWLDVPGLWGHVLILGAILLVAMDVARDRFWRRHYRTKPKYRGAITAQVGPEGVGVDSQETRDMLPWSTFRYVHRSDAFIYLVITQRVFSVIPVAAFDDLQHAAVFERVCLAHLPRLPRRML